MSGSAGGLGHAICLRVRMTRPRQGCCLQQGINRICTSWYLAWYLASGHDDDENCVCLAGHTAIASLLLAGMQLFVDIQAILRENGE